MRKRVGVGGGEERGWERVLMCAVVGTRQKVMGGWVGVVVRVRVRCVAWCDTEHMGVGVISWALMPTMSTAHFLSLG